ncbi:uncharacterized protein LOC122533389 isoform X1 [Frieseomelitta varia]|uniref:uncharacterized protein LOC122533389 isoform X1 n=1 Tax=Frieseomelitta varia TaxID=561572 RepID=UPI001CB69EF8|nr:uncharacterized protein LOC122533389 isoform X1 [Frieseomelitta varia]
MRSCFLWLFPVFVATTLVKIERVMGANNFKHEQNIGTVLFEKSDATKHCWTTEEFIILNSRRMFQDLLPKVKVLNYENDRYIALLMDYFHLCLESVRKLSIGKTKHLMLKALADTMGGYLQVYILPLTRHSYYAGNIKYRNARKLFELYEQLKVFLRSNGAGWLNPSKEIKQTKISPIVITLPRTSIACDGIITYSASSIGNKWEIKRFTFKQKKKHAPRHKTKSTSSRQKDESDRSEESIIIPLPFLDDDTQPNSIALPFKKNTLQSLYSERSIFALVKYYIASVKCIVSKSKAKTELETFNQEFYNWLQQSVQRHLDDEKWYPAFGGVLRVIASLEEAGAGTGPTKGGKSGIYQVMPKIGVESTVEPEEAVLPLYKEEETGVTLGTTELISIAVVSALLVWLLVGLSVVCYRFLMKHTDESVPCEPQDPPVAVLYDNKEYCEADTCVAQTPHKRLLERMKDCWKNKFGKCRAGCQDRMDEERCLAAISYTSKDTVDVSNSSRSYQKRKMTKSVSATLSSHRKERVPIKKVYYSSDGSLTTNTESPRKPRQ